VGTEPKPAPDGSNAVLVGAFGGLGAAGLIVVGLVVRVELTGIPVSQINDSFSFVPLLSDRNGTNSRAFAFAEVCNNNDRYTIRDVQHKLSYDNGVWGLYDLINDPVGLTNLYDAPGVADEQASLEAELVSLQQSVSFGCFQ
jgi:hypothetical protein